MGAYAARDEAVEKPAAAAKGSRADVVRKRRRLRGGFMEERAGKVRQGAEAKRG
jgi:hypothetical protein